MQKPPELSKSNEKLMIRTFTRHFKTNIGQ
jgi:hypothetical protein